MNIGQVVKELKKDYPSVTISRLRFLEKEGLIKPKRSSGGTRIFTNKDLKKLYKILDLQENKYYSLKAIKNNSSLLTGKDTKQITISEYSKHDVLKNSGVSEKEFDELVKFEFEDDKEIFNNIDLERLKSWSFFLELGLAPRNFTTIKSVSDRTEGFTDYLITTIQDEYANKELIAENLTKIIKGLILKK
tara:strand:- start:1605 stop:2174 length:570 start_codon:yes stop_codon:yes gene_type:complete